jgi:hypothetical protein
MHHYYAGMGGAGDTAVQAGSTAATIAAPFVFGTAAAPTALGASVGAILGSSALVLPVVGAAIAGISIAIEAILHSGCGQTCIVTSQWANQAEGYLQKNIDAYFAVPIPRPRSVQQVAMANFQAIWNTLVQQCNQPGLGAAGQNCINDRKDGACKWQAKAPQYPGEPAVGQCWNWWNGYYYPIANDPNVVDDSVLAAAANPITSAISSITGGGSSSYLIIGAAILGGVLLLQAVS